ncbi:MAG: NAD-dependent epimerase/dehydratase family protein [Deltaproteobacteria bacterium]|jgi:dihydroflavonol-4-reductase
MKIFITGATGFLGKAVVDELIGAGHELRALVRNKHARLPEAVEKVEVGFDEGGRLREMLHGMDAIMHLAGKVSRRPEDSADMHWIHVEATRMLLDAARDVGVRRFVLSSTSGTIAVSEEKGRPATEDDAPKFEVIGRWPYYTSKHLQEEEVLRRNAKEEIDAVILNPSLLLGPGDERLSSTTDVLNILNKRVPAITDGTIAFVDVRDCAPSFLRALTDGKRGQRYLLNGANMSVRSFMERIAHCGGVSPPSLKLKSKWALAGAKLMEGVYGAFDGVPPVDAVSVEMSGYHWGCDASRAERELGFVARDPQQTIEATVVDLEKRGLFRRR